MAKVTVVDPTRFSTRVVDTRRYATARLGESQVSKCRSVPASAEGDAKLRSGSEASASTDGVSPQANCSCSEPPEAPVRSPASGAGRHDEKSRPSWGFPVVRYTPRGQPRSDWYDRTAELEWQDMSRGVYATRMLGLSHALTDSLMRAAREDPRTPFAPLYALWAVDNSRHGGRHAEAIRLGGEFEKLFSSRTHRGVPLLDHVLSAVADSMRVEGDADAARSVLERLVLVRRGRGEQSPLPLYQLGELEAELGHHKRAAEFFSRAASSGDARTTGIPEFREGCLRQAARLRSNGQSAFRTPEQLALRLWAALSQRDADRLAALVSKTHFALGAIGGHTHFASVRDVLGPLLRDLKSTDKLQGSPQSLEGQGHKRYMVTLGWTGETYLLGVAFILTEGPFGWEWTGIAPLLQTPKSKEISDAVWGPKDSRENQPLSVRIKAPWPGGLGFQAGGLGKFLEILGAEQAAAAANVAIAVSACAGSCVAALWYWPVCMGICAPIAASAAYAATLAAFAGARGVLADRDCGFGPGGFYYNQEGHSRGGGLEQQYAIDFTRWERLNGGYFPPNGATGLPILACHSGVVEAYQYSSMATRGDPLLGNGLYHSLADSWDEDRSGARYTAQYLHFDGPNRLTVSPGMWVDQGFVLGLIDDTGNSAYDHVHFQVNDRTLPSDLANPFGRSTRPTPMDGPAGPQTLNDEDDNRCVVSDNLVANPLTLCRVLLSARTDLDPITRATLRALCGLRFGPDPLAPIRPDVPGVSDVLEPPASRELPGGRRP